MIVMCLIDINTLANNTLIHNVFNVLSLSFFLRNRRVEGKLK